MRLLSVILTAVLLATAAGAQTPVKATAPDPQAAEAAADTEAKAFEEFKKIAQHCRDAGGCLIVTQRAAARDLNAAFNAGVQQGQLTCGKGAL